MVFWSRFTVLISKAKELSFCRWVSEWASLALLGVLVVWFAGFCYLIENLPSGGKIIPLRGKKKKQKKTKQTPTSGNMETWKLLLSAHGVPRKCSGATEKAFTDPNISLQVTTVVSLCPCSWVWSFFFISHPLQHPALQNQDKSISSTSSMNHHSSCS